jgi:hypothetical protein
MRIRFQLLAPMAIGFAIVGGSLALAQQQPVETDPPPARQPDVTPVVGPAGQTGPFNFNIPEKVADPGDATMYGVYRLIPWGYAKALDYQTVP